MERLTRSAKRFVFPLIGNVPLHDMEPFHIHRVLRNVEENGGCKEQVQVHVRDMPHKIFADAMILDNAIDFNPVKMVKRPRIPLKSRAFLNPEESRKLLTSVRDKPEGCIVWISLLSALRPCEAITLQYQDIDFEHDCIRIKRSYRRREKAIVDRPKQKSWGVAVMPPVLKEYLIERKRSVSDECFVISNDAKPASYNSLQKQIRKLCSSAGVSRISLYELRHSHTELLYEAGASLEDTRRQLNHSSLNATRTYIHRTDDRLKKIVGMVTVGEPSLPRRPVLRIIRDSPAQ